MLQDDSVGARQVAIDTPATSVLQDDRVGVPEHWVWGTLSVLPATRLTLTDTQQQQ